MARHIIIPNQHGQQVKTQDVRVYVIHMQVRCTLLFTLNKTFVRRMLLLPILGAACSSDPSRGVMADPVLQAS